MKTLQLFTALLVLSVAGTVTAKSPQDRVRQTYNKVRRATTVRINRRTTVRPSTSGIEIKHRGRSSRTTVNVGRVQRWRRQTSRSSRSRSYGVSIGIRW